MVNIGALPMLAVILLSIVWVKSREVLMLLSAMNWSGR
jgi:hypothetical protein